MDVQRRKNPVMKFTRAPVDGGAAVRARACSRIRNGMRPQHARGIRVDGSCVRISDASMRNSFSELLAGGTIGVAGRRDADRATRRARPAPLFSKAGCKEPRRAGPALGATESLAERGAIGRSAALGAPGTPGVRGCMIGAHAFHITPNHFRAEPNQDGARSAQLTMPSTRAAAALGAPRSVMRLKTSSGTLWMSTGRELRRGAALWYASCTPESMRANSQFCARVMQEPPRDAEVAPPAECSDQRRASGGFPWRR